MTSNNRFIRDRGNKKWSSIMLPEHKQMLYELQHEQDDVERVELTEDKLEEIQYIIRRAISEGLPVRLTYHANQRHQEIIGNVSKFDAINQMISLTEDERIYKVRISDIVDCAEA